MSQTLVLCGAYAQSNILDEDVEDYDEEISPQEAQRLIDDGDVEVEELDEDVEAPETTSKKSTPDPKPNKAKPDAKGRREREDRDNIEPVSKVVSASTTPTENARKFFVKVGEKCGTTCLITVLVTGVVSTLLFGTLIAALVFTIVKSRQTKQIIKPEVHESWI